MTPEERKSFEESPGIGQVVGGPWPNGLQGVGYLSGPVTEKAGAYIEWSVDADFGLPAGVAGGPFTGPFASAVAGGFRFVTNEQPQNRPVHCFRLEMPLPELSESDSFCAGATQQVQTSTSDLKIATPKKPAQAFVGGKGKVSFPLEFAGTGPTVPPFVLTASTTAKGATTDPQPSAFSPTAPDPTTHLSKSTGKVAVSLPKKVKPGAYQVTLTATTTQGGSVSGTATLKVTKPKLKLGKVKANPAKGTATLKVTVPAAGKLTIGGKGVKKVKKKVKGKKAKTLKVKIAPGGSTARQLAKTGKVKLKVKATFKPTSGISVSKKKSIALKKR
jgi:hypothetical protein